MISKAKIFRWSELRSDIEQKVKDCIACLATGRNPKYQIPKNKHCELKTLNESGQKLQIHFTGKTHDKNLNEDVQLLIAIDRFSRWPTVKICKTSETKYYNLSDE